MASLPRQYHPTTLVRENLAPKVPPTPNSKTLWGDCWITPQSNSCKIMENRRVLPIHRFQISCRPTRCGGGRGEGVGGGGGGGGLPSNWGLGGFRVVWGVFAGGAVLLSPCHTVLGDYNGNHVTVAIPGGGGGGWDRHTPGSGGAVVGGAQSTWPLT